MAYNKKHITDVMINCAAYFSVKEEEGRLPAAALDGTHHPQETHPTRRIRLCFHLLGLDDKEVQQKRKDLWDIVRDCTNRDIPTTTLKCRYSWWISIHANPHHNRRALLQEIYRVSRVIFALLHLSIVGASNIYRERLETPLDS